jgi:FkbM family methyltransferase
MDVKNFGGIERIKIVDVGARFGINTPWDQLEDSSIYVMGFEPDVDECKKLNLNTNLNCIYMPTGLSDVDDEITLFVTEQPGCTSIYKPNVDFFNKLYNGEQFNVVSEHRIKTKPLSTVLNEKNFQPDFIKIDAQGAAYKILKGAGSYLNNIMMLEIEVEFSELYFDEPLFSDVDMLLRNYKFQILDINKYYGKRKILPKYNSARGQVFFGDILYYMPIESFIEQNILNLNFKIQTIKYVKMLKLYGFFDIALELILHINSPLDLLEKNKFQNEILKKSKISKFIILLCDNIISNKIGQFLIIIGNTLMIKNRTAGWGSDYLNEDSRYKYYRNGTFSKFFKK